VTLSLAGPGGLVQPLAWSVGLWPAQLPLFSLPGYSCVMTLSAQDDQGNLSAVERTDPSSGAPPSFLPLPEVPALGADSRTLTWQGPVGQGALAIYPRYQPAPAWEAVVHDHTVALPSLPARPDGYEVEVQAWDALDVPLPSAFRAGGGDRRYAIRRLSWSGPATQSPPL
jgi:hypothetical protein